MQSGQSRQQAVQPGNAAASDQRKEERFNQYVLLERTGHNEKAPDRPKWRGNPELFVYEKVAFSPLLWYNKGKETENTARREMQWVFT